MDLLPRQRRPYASRTSLSETALRQSGDKPLGRHRSDDRVEYQLHDDAVVGLVLLLVTSAQSLSAPLCLRATTLQLVKPFLRFWEFVSCYRR